MARGSTMLSQKRIGTGGSLGALALVVLGGLVLGGLAHGCSGGTDPADPLCTPDSERPCACEGETLDGTQICAEDGMAWGSCLCEEDPCDGVDCPEGEVCEVVSGEGVCVPDESTWQDPPTTRVTPPGTDAILLNPERGFYRYVNVVTGRNFSGVRTSGSTLVYSYVRLDDYREEDLDAALLTAVEAGLGAVRAAGLKLILRFAYNFGPYPDSEPDASKSWVLRHIEQVGPVLRANADVISVVQAGFIGAWGEWHSSTNGLLDGYGDKYDILEALLGELPEERMVQLRYPPHKREEYGDALTPSEAHGGTIAARLGHHNDCFLASDYDMGTYPWGEDVEIWKSYLALDTRYVPMGGETCAVNPPRSSCPTALEEMERLHFSYINNDYHEDVVAGWEDQGCREVMERRLGYRLVITAYDYPPEAPPGGALPLGVTLVNEGWAAPFNPRPLVLVLGGPETHLLVIPPAMHGDVRLWLPGGEIHVTLRAKLPTTLADGTYQLSLWLPDAAEDLAEDPRYAIRFANDGLWDEGSGLNHLGTVEIHGDAPGSVHPGFTTFEVME